MDEHDAMSELRRYGLHLHSIGGAHVGVRGTMSILCCAGHRPRDGVARLEDDESMGRHQESACGAEDEPTPIGHVHGAKRNRPYAVANLTQQTVTMLCADNAAVALAKSGADPADVVWWSTRTPAEGSHLHHADGTCVPKVFDVRRMGARLAH